MNEFSFDKISFSLIDFFRFALSDMNNDGDDDDERSIAFYVIERLILLDMLAACMEDLLHEGLIQVYII